MSLVNLKDVKESEGGKATLLAEGMYEVQVKTAEVVSTKNGKAIKTLFTAGNSNTGIFHYFNIENTNAQAQQISLGQLKTFLIGAGHFNPEELDSTQDMIGLKCAAKVGVRKSEQYGDSNVISYFKTNKPFTKEDDAPVEVERTGKLKI